MYCDFTFFVYSHSENIIGFGDLLAVNRGNVEGLTIDTLFHYRRHK